MKRRLYSLAYLGMMILFLYVYFDATNPIRKVLSLVSSSCWLIAFIICQFRAYKN